MTRHPWIWHVSVDTASNPGIWIIVRRYDPSSPDMTIIQGYGSSSLDMAHRPRIRLVVPRYEPYLGPMRRSPRIWPRITLREGNEAPKTGGVKRSSPRHHPCPTITIPKITCPYFCTIVGPIPGTFRRSDSLAGRL